MIDIEWASAWNLTSRWWLWTITRSFKEESERNFGKVLWEGSRFSFHVSDKKFDRIYSKEPVWLIN